MSLQSIHSLQDFCYKSTIHALYVLQYAPIDSNRAKVMSNSEKIKLLAIIELRILTINTVPIFTA